MKQVPCTFQTLPIESIFMFVTDSSCGPYPWALFISQQNSFLLSKSQVKSSTMFKCVGKVNREVSLWKTLTSVCQDSTVLSYILHLLWILSPTGCQACARFLNTLSEYDYVLSSLYCILLTYNHVVMSASKVSRIFFYTFVHLPNKMIELNSWK